MKLILSCPVQNAYLIFFNNLYAEMKCVDHQCALVDIQIYKLAHISCIFKTNRGLITDTRGAPHGTFRKEFFY